MDDKVLRSARDGDLFRSFSFLVAVRTLPNLITGKTFFSAVMLETMTDVTHARLGYFHTDTVEGFVGS